MERDLENQPCSQLSPLWSISIFLSEGADKRGVLLFCHQGNSSGRLENWFHWYLLDPSGAFSAIGVGVKVSDVTFEGRIVHKGWSSTGFHTWTTQIHWACMDAVKFPELFCLQQKQKGKSFST